MWLVRQPYYENNSIYLKLNSTAEKNSTANLMKNSSFTKGTASGNRGYTRCDRDYPSKKLGCEIVVPNHSENAKFRKQNLLLGHFCNNLV